MPRYFFHLDGYSRITDDEGEEFPTPQAAEEHARIVAAELVRNAKPLEYVGRSVILTDDRARELLRVPLQRTTEPR